MKKSRCTEILRSKFNIYDQKIISDILNLNRKYCKSLIKLEKYLKDVSSFSFEALEKYYEYTSNLSATDIMYKWEVYAIKYSVSEDEARNMVACFKKNKATSKEKFIERHGVEVGEELFKKFQKTSSSNTSVQYFQEKYGDQWETERVKYFRTSSKRCVEYWQKKGFNYEESVNKVSEYQQQTSGVHKQYYLNLGYSEQEADDILSLINIKKGQNSRNLQFLKEKFPSTWKEEYSKSLQKQRKSMVEKGLWLDEKLLSTFYKYKKEVERLTAHSVILFKDMIVDLDKRGKEYHLDHRFSIKAGFVEEIIPEIIASPVNLEILPVSVNTSKRENCSITKEQLLERYKELYADENYKY